MKYKAASQVVFMNDIVLIGCGGRKQESGAWKACELYTSAYFKLKYKYAQSFNCPIHIISAKHHLVDIDEMIEPYDCTLKGKGKKTRMLWAEEVVRNLKEKYGNLDDYCFIILAGKDYYECLVELLGADHCKLPLNGMRIGQQNMFMKDRLENR